MKRSSGILMAMSSLPSPYGIGTMGKAAYEFIDFLHAAGQKYWQLLPIGPTSYGDSPYASPSSFAGNPYLIDLDLLIKDKLLTAKDVKGIDWGSDPQAVDYGKIYNGRYPVLRKAFANGREKLAGDMAAFRAENPWVENYALYMAVKGKFDNKCWVDWPDASIRRRESAAVARYSEELKDEVDFWVFTQTVFFAQWEKLRAYAKEKGVLFIGDIPIYVAMDSADIWAEPQWFQLDGDYKPARVSGCPPDAFTADGQLWGNPLYDYDRMKADGFGWWIRRVGGAARLYDVIRIDHFRGFESFWSIPAGDKTARNGKWVKGPGMDLVGAPITGWFSNIEFIAEDLGYMTPEVQKLLADSKLPGMKVLEFGFDAHGETNHLPHESSFNSCMYIGTHDNDTVLGWLKTLSRADKAFAQEYMHITEDEGWVYGMIRTGMASPSNLFVMQMQDVLELDGFARMNTPGKPMGNWSWRMLPGAATKPIAARLKKYAQTYRRAPLPEKKAAKKEDAENA